VSWLRKWLNRAKSESTENAGHEPADSGPARHDDSQAGAQSGFHIRDAERRQLRRLLRRRDNLLYDLQRAEDSLAEDNQWTERIEQLNQAIEQAMADRAAIEPKPSAVERPQLGPQPIEIVELREAEPAAVTLQIGETRISYREEIDWAERGHQVTIPELRRVDGDVDALVPALPDDNAARELKEHLLHSLAILANQGLESAAAGEAPPALTLADITRPCEQCGGWLDQKDRCPDCAELDWKREQIDADLRRIRKERDEVIQDLERQRDRLPIIQRQIAETESDIETLRAKGVEPAS
jgi:hypothetical protein